MVKRDSVQKPNLNRFLLSVCLILIFMGSLLVFEQRSESGIEKVAIEQLRGNFYLAIANIRMLSLQLGQGTHVTYQEREVDLNRRGKPQILDSNGDLMCEMIWQQVMGQDIQLTGRTIRAEQLTDRELSGKHHAASKAHRRQSVQGCRYFADNVRLFDYFP